MICEACLSFMKDTNYNNVCVHKSQCIQMGLLLRFWQDSIIHHDAQDTFLVLKKLPAHDTTNHPSTILQENNISTHTYVYIFVRFSWFTSLFYELWTTRMSNQVNNNNIGFCLSIYYFGGTHFLSSLENFRIFSNPSSHNKLVQ